MDDTRTLQVAQLGGGFIGADSFFIFMALPPYVVDGVMRESPVHAHHGLGKLADVYVIGPGLLKVKTANAAKEEKRSFTGKTFADEFNGYAIKCKRFYIIRVESSIYFFY